MKLSRGLVYAVISALLWGMVNPFIKEGLAFGITPMNFAGVRFAAAGIVLLLVTSHRGMWREIRENRRLFLNLIVINMLLGYSAFYYGVDMVSAAISSIVMGMTPLVNVLLAHFLAHNDRLTTRKSVSLAVSFAGLLLIIGVGGEGNGMLDARSIFGILLLVANIILQGYSAIRVAEYPARINPVFMNGVQMFFGGLAIYIAGVAAEGFTPLWEMPREFFFWLGCLVFISIFAFSFWFTALRLPYSKVSELNICRLLTPVFGAVLSWCIVEGEHPTWSTVVGMIVIVAAMVVFFRGNNKARA